MGLHEGSGDAAGDGDELGRGGEDFDEGGRRELGQVDLHAVAQAAGDLLVDRDGGELWKQSSRVREQGGEGGFGVGSAGGCFELVEAKRLVESEDAGADAAEAGEVSSAAGELAELMGDGADVASGGDGHRKARHVIFKREQAEIVDEDAGGLNGNGKAGAGKLVGGHSPQLLGREDGRHLVHLAVEVGGELLKFGERKRERARLGGGGAVGVEAVGSEAEADGAGVLFVGLGAGLGEELGEAGVAAEQQGQDAGGHGVEGAEMTDGLFVGGSADERDDVMRGEAGRFVEDEEAVEGHDLV